MTDPTRPAEPVDVMVAGDDRDPWRPGKRTWILLAVLVVLAAIAVPVGLDRQHQADERALDSAAAKDVALAPTADPVVGAEPVPNVIGIGLRNDTDQNVTLVGYHVQGAGYTAQQVDLPILPYEIVHLGVPDTATCAVTVLTKEPPSIRLRVRTSRGQVVTLTADLVDAAGSALALGAQQRCGLRKPLDAFISQIIETSTIKGRTLTVTTIVANTGRLPLRIASLESFPGVTVTTSRPLPLALPYTLLDSSHPLTGTPLTFRLTVTDCAQATSPAQLNTDSGETITTAGAVQVHLDGALGPVTTSLYLENTDRELAKTVCR
jgi:hypothetical protein